MTMFVSALALIVAAMQAASSNQIQAPATAVAPSVPQTSSTVLFQTSPVVAEPVRVQITPNLDRLNETEWDPFSSSPDSKTYLQWEPGVIYAGGSGPAGSDMVLSLDLGHDGWLVGSDNYEARVSTDGTGKAIVKVRRLNAKNVAGPVWEDLPGWEMASSATVTTEGGKVQYELRLTDADTGVLPRKGTTVGARVDMISSGEQPLGTVQPRLLGTITLASTRAEGLPSNLHYDVERSDRPVVAGETSSVRFNFSSPKGEIKAKKIEIAAEGDTRAKMNAMNSPFPIYDTRGRGFVDYVSKVPPSASPGFHVLKATITLSDDTPATVETSFEVVPTISVDVQNPVVAASPQDRSVRISYSIKSNVPKPMRGEVTFSTDPRFKVLNRNGNSDKFVLEPKGRQNRRFTLFIPGNTKGTYPVDFVLDAGGTKTKITNFVTIQ